MSPRGLAMKSGITGVVIFAAALCTATTSYAQEGVHCAENGATIFAARPAQGGIQFSLIRFNKAGQFFGASGIAKPNGNGWRFAENLTDRDLTKRCAIDIARAGQAWTFRTEDGARCEANAGRNGTFSETITIPDRGRIAPADNKTFEPEAMQHYRCK
jgi:hypothetical protein